jgi:hypothetical protein
MNVSMMVRHGAAMVLAAIAVTACSDVPTTPFPSRAPAEAAFARGGQSGYHDPLAGGNADDDPSLPDAPRASQRDGTGMTTFVVYPNETRSYAVGPHSVYIPRGTVCDPATSGYGPAYWDAPCSTLSAPITVTARWARKGGHGAIAFEPYLRFKPSTDARRWVRLTLRDRKLISDSRFYGILWYNPASKGWVDEASSDPTLRAYVNKDRNEVYRRVKHFSGYLVCASFRDDGGFGGADAW